MGFEQFSPEFLNNFRHLEKRGNNSFGKCLIALSEEEINTLPPQLESFFFLSSTDTGVILNGGRRGAEYGPLAIINLLKKASIPTQALQHSCGIIEVSCQKKERDNFEKAQEKEANLIEKFLLKRDLYGPNLKAHWHLGGGNDHIYPLVLALLKQQQVKKITVINLDPHLDTRNDEISHSGTPFRQLSNAAKQFQKKVDLFQWGTRAFANPASNFELDNHNYFKMTIWPEKEHSLKHYLTSLTTLEEGHFFILGLDCDVFKSSLMTAVSAPAWQGVELEEIEDLFAAYLGVCHKNQRRPIIGIYEYNPLYEDLSQKGARMLGALIYSSFFKNTD